MTLRSSGLRATLAGLALGLTGLFATNATAQTRDLGAERLLLDDGAGHIIRISVPSSGFPGPGIYDYVLPIPPAGVDAGFVQEGTAVNKYLTWNDALGYHQAVPNLAGSIGTGTMNTLTKWAADGGSLVNSAVVDDGSTVSINNVSLLLAGTSGTTPASGAGTRMMWIPAKAAFRAGLVSSAHWDDVNVGIASFAVGRSTVASGTNSTAWGSGSVASGLSSTAGGQNTAASGDFSFAVGNTSTASAENAIALGSFVTASGENAVAVGIGVDASSENAIAIGSSIEATGLEAVAIGNNADAPAVGATAVGSGAEATESRATAVGPSIASGQGSFAAGYASNADQQGSVAVGYSVEATGDRSVAIGALSEASGSNTIAIGSGALATDIQSVAIGDDAVSSGFRAVALGQAAIASGSHAFSLGSGTASGNFSYALGLNSSTAGYAGSFIYTDGNLLSLSNTAANQFMVQASGGTVFYTDAAATVGVELLPNANAWSSISDSNRKENRLLANGEAVLSKLEKMWLGSWNYIGQDAATNRHYGPMAQEFYAAFGHDGVGTSGNDTRLNSADVDGINMIAIQALIKRTNALEEENELLRRQNAMLMGRVNLIEKAVHSLTTDEVIIREASVK